MNTREVGNKKEESVCIYLAEHGVKIKERNFRCRCGEIDIVGHEGGYLVFFEVKYRKGIVRGSALEAVGAAKQRRICRTADYYRLIHRCPPDTPIRFDVVGIDGEEMQWVKNAFEYSLA